MSMTCGFEIPCRVTRMSCLDVSYSDTPYDVRYYCATLHKYIDLYLFSMVLLCYDIILVTVYTLDN